MTKVKLPSGSSVVVDGHQIPNLSQVLAVNNDGGGLQIKNIGDPTNNQDAVTLKYFNDHSSTGSITSVSGTANQITSNTVGGTVTLGLPSSVIFPGTWTIGTLSYSDTGILWSAQSSINSYNQVIIQNTSNQSAASANFIVNNDISSATLNYGEFGINSTTFTGSGAWNQASAVYLDAISGPLAIGTLANQSIRFFTNSATTDRLSIDGSGVFTFSSPNLTYNQIAQSSSWATTATFNPGAHTGYTAATEFIDYDFKNRTVTWLDGTVATQRFAYFRGNTVNKTTTSAIFTDIFTAYFDPSIAGTGVTFTRNWAAGFNGSVLINGNLQFKAGAGVNIGTFDNNIMNWFTNSTQRFSISSTGIWTYTGSPTAGGNTTWMTYTQNAASSGTNSGIVWTAAAHTNQTTATEVTDINFNLSAVLKIADGTVANQRAFRIQGRTYTPQTSALTLTEASTLEVTAPTAGSGTTITNGDNWAIRCTGNLKVTGSRINAASLPTSSSGLASGDIWKNGNVLNIV